MEVRETFLDIKSSIYFTVIFTEIKTSGHLLIRKYKELCINCQICAAMQININLDIFLDYYINIISSILSL